MWNRREFLWTTAGLCGATTLARANAPAEKKRSLRIAHLTDIHVQPEREAARGMAACLHHVQEQSDKVDLVLVGGDCVMDSFGATQDRTRQQWDVWKGVLKADCSLPVEACIGNHDVWGWNKKDSQTTGKEPLHGKKWAMEMLDLPERYRSFDKAGWHLIALDSTQPGPAGDDYKAFLDEEQFEWLARDLAAVDPKTPVLVWSHIPILSAASFMDGDNEKSGDWIVPGSWMHLDARKIKDLFLKHPNVKLCLSGHLHLVDRVDYCGVTYLCNGAVCGAWWKGDNQECDEGYALVDLYSDGSFESQYVGFGWQVKG